MPGFNMSNLNAGIKFEHPDGGDVTIRTCSTEVLAKIGKETTKTELRFIKGLTYTVKKSDDQKQNELIWDYCIVDWSGFFDENNKPIECTTANKIRLMNQSVEFANFIAECMSKYEEQYIKNKEKTEKN